MPDTDLVFLEPTSVLEAAAQLAKYGSAAKVLAGGTAMVLLMQQKLIHPSVLISLGRVDGLRGIDVDGQGELQIGAMTQLKQVASHERVGRDWPLLAQACAAVGNLRLRNQATLGGNLAEADYASDPPAALMALEARLKVCSPYGERIIDLADFFQGFSTTALQEDEILTEIFVPPIPVGAASIYVKYKSRSAIDRPCVGLAVILAEDKGVCKWVRIAVGAVSGAPQRFSALEQQLSGQLLTADSIASFADDYAAAIESPLDDLRGSAWYRREMTCLLIKRTLSTFARLEIVT